MSDPRTKEDALAPLQCPRHDCQHTRLQLEKAIRERDQYKDQAKVNAQTIVRQAHVIRKLQRGIV